MDPVEIFEALLTPAGKADPYPYYARLHEHGSSAELAPGATLVFGYDAIDANLRDAAFRVPDAEHFDQIFPGWQDHPSLAMESVQSLNPPRHGQIRGLLNKAFTHRRVASLEPAIVELTDRLLDEFADRGAGGMPVDFVALLAYRLPLIIICELIGIPPADRADFFRMATTLATTLELETDLEVLTDADKAAVELRDYVVALAATRRADPCDDLLSALVALADAQLTESELLDNVMMLLVAGFETTTGMFGNGMDVLLRDPALAAAIRSGAVPAAAFVEETLRYDAPVQLAARRHIRSGQPPEEVMLLIGAGNRDPGKFAAPDAFDPGRTEHSMLSFGVGAHFCLGAALTRMEGAVAFGRLLARFPKLTPAGPAVRRPGFVLRGFESMPVTLG
jgi:cytochrome P450